MPPTGQFIILTPGFPRDENDTTCVPGLQSYVLAVKKLFPAVRLTVVTFQYPFEKKDYLWHGVRVIAIGGASRGKLFRLLTWMKVWLWLRRLTREGDVIGMISKWLGECAFVGDRFCRRHGLKHYMWLSGQDARKTNHYIKRIKPDPNHILALSDFVREELTQNFGITPFCVANNGIRPDAFPELNTGPRQFDLVGVGSLIPLKNYSVLVDLVHRLKPWHPSIRTAIAGAGPERQALAAQIERLGLQQNVVLLGNIPHARVFELVNNARILVHPATFDANAGVMNEALYAGCRVVAFIGLSRAPVENLHVCDNETQMLGTLEQWLAEPAWPVRRVLFNSMDDTARKIMALYAT